MKKFALVLSTALAFAASALAAGTSLKAEIEGMHCESCVKAVTAKLKKLPEVVQVEVKITDPKKQNGYAVVTLKEGAKADPEAVKKAIADAGYEAKSIQ